MFSVKPLYENLRSQPPEGDFILAHLSDPHLSSLAGVRPRDLLNKRALGYVSWCRRRRHIHRTEVLEALVADLAATAPDHIVVTGDFTHLGLPAEFNQAARWLAGLGEPDRVTAVPGNHDAYVAAPWQQTMGRLHPYLASDAGLDAAPEALFPSLRLRGPLALIGLSSSCPSGPFTATGRLGREQLATLERILASPVCRQRLRVLLVHHPPAPRSVSWRRRLTDADGLAGVLRRQGAELVLHGHAHHSLFRDLAVPGGRVPVVGVPSASDAGDRGKEAACLHLYRFRCPEGIWTVDMEVRRYHGDGRVRADPDRSRQFRLNARPAGD